MHYRADDHGVKRPAAGAVATSHSEAPVGGAVKTDRN
jgi:hypothetical protein